MQDVWTVVEGVGSVAFLALGLVGLVIGLAWFAPAGVEFTDMIAILIGWLVASLVLSRIVRAVLRVVQAPLIARLALALRPWWIWRLKRKAPARLAVRSAHSAELRARPCDLAFEPETGVLVTPMGRLDLSREIFTHAERSESPVPQLRLCLLQSGRRPVVLARALAPHESPDVARREGEAIVLNPEVFAELVTALQPAVEGSGVSLPRSVRARSVPTRG